MGRFIEYCLVDKKALLIARYRPSFKKMQEELSERVTAYAGPRVATLCAAMHAHATVHPREDTAPLSPLIELAAQPPQVVEAINAVTIHLWDCYP